MKFVLADIKNGKICGLYGGRNPKYYDVWNYVGSTDVEKCGFKFDTIEDALKTKTALNNTGLLQPNFEIIVVTEGGDKYEESHFSLY